MLHCNGRQKTYKISSWSTYTADDQRSTENTQTDYCTNTLCIQWKDFIPHLNRK